MKKGLLFILMLAYSLSSIGMTISLHYCCGKLKGVSFPAKHATDCDKGHEVKKSKCCSDQQVCFKVQSEYQQPVPAASSYKTFVAVALPSAAYSAFHPQAALTGEHKKGTPPPLLSVPLFLKHCVFRI